MSGRVESLEREREVLVAQLASLGVKRPADLQAEFDAVSREVGRILQAAREAADALRSRAAEDATRWRREASSESEQKTSSAEADAIALRQDAWETSTRMLDEVTSEAESRRRQAAEDVLLIRAEGEQEAHRLVSQGRREIEEESRLTRLESERMLSRVRTEAEDVIENARQEAEAAQERARALEQRRTELMEELEDARTAIADLETELTTRRESLRLPEAEPEEVVDSTSVRVVPTGNEEDNEWVDADETVRIVRKKTVVPEEPVDALEMAEEVGRLRQKVAEEPEPVAEEPEPEPVAEEPEPEPAAEEPEPVAVPDTPLRGTPIIDDLFERLRSGGMHATKAEGTGTSTAVAERPAAATTVSAPLDEATVDGVDPFDLRDSLLLPVTNRALREVKRTVVDMQNHVLEDIRTGGAAGEPNQGGFEKALRAPLITFGEEAEIAGHTAAAELLDAAPNPDAAVSGIDPTADFASALVDAVREAMDRFATVNAGPRETGAAVSRVFRAWRTDEAERRMRNSAFGAYHQGLLAGFDSFGVRAVRAVASGRPCGECPSIGSESWTPGGPPPTGTTLPPALLDCACTIVPAD